MEDTKGIQINNVQDMLTVVECIEKLHSVRETQGFRMTDNNDQVDETISKMLDLLNASLPESDPHSGGKVMVHETEGFAYTKSTPVALS